MKKRRRPGRIAQRRQQIGNDLRVDMRCLRRASFGFSFCRQGFAFVIAQIPRRTINPASGGSATPRRMSSRSRTRATLPEPTAEEKRVDDALRKHKLVSQQGTIFTDDPVHCFFHAWLDEWRAQISPPSI